MTLSLLPIVISLYYGMQVDFSLYVDLSEDPKMLITYLWQPDFQTSTFVYI